MIYGSRLRVVRHTVNQGYGGAVRSGFRAAAKDYVFYTDGDGQYDITELPRLVEALGPGIGLVNGYKTSRSDVSRHWARSCVMICPASGITAVWTMLPPW